MGDKTKLNTFILVFFLTILLSELADRYFFRSTAWDSWWQFAGMIPLILIAVVFGFFLKGWKELLAHSLFGTLTLFIYIAIQTYFNTAEFAEFGNDIFLILKVSVVSFWMIMVTIMFCLSLGMLSAFVYKLFLKS